MSFRRAAGGRGAVAPAPSLEVSPQQSNQYNPMSADSDGKMFDGVTNLQPPTCLTLPQMN